MPDSAKAHLSVRRRRAIPWPCVSWVLSALAHLLLFWLGTELIFLGLPVEEDVVVVVRFRRPAPPPEEPPPPPPPAGERVEREGEQPGPPGRVEEPARPAPVAVPVLPPPVPALPADARPVPAGVLEGVPAIGAGDLGAPSAGVFQGRRRERREEAVARYGGTAAGEDAVELGLRWLAAHQGEDGRWSTGRTKRCPANDLCSAAGKRGEESEAAMTGLALLAFLGRGNTHQDGEHQGPVAAGLRWLLGRQRESGHFTDPREGNMYVHGVCATAVAEACAMTGDAELRRALGRALAAIDRSQLPAGGWDYSPAPPGKGGEMTLSVWQMMALRSAMEAGVEVPGRAVARAKEFLRRLTDSSGAVRYVPGGECSMGSTGAGLFAKCMFGMAERGAVDRGLEALREMSRDEEPGPELARIRVALYAWHYRTLVEFQRQGKGWREWNRALRPHLVSTQLTRGHAAGSWSISDYPEMGRVYSTALCILMLEVYYRYPPAEGRTAADVVGDATDAAVDGPTPAEVQRIERMRPPAPEVLAERRRREREEAAARLRSAKPEDRYLGARKLAELEDAGEVPEMIRAAEKETGNLKALHVGCIGRVKNPEAVPYLVRLLDDPEEQVRSAAIAALVRTTGLRLGEASRWKEWHASREGVRSRP